ncbi:MAG: transglutaminase [Clostridiales bacterium 38-18]|nr:MAG: transglutaminase [Clostridiales bacterium 38-18]
MNQYLEPTELLDYESQNITKLVNARGWRQIDNYSKILQIYNFVKDEISFGYNIDDAIKSSRVLSDGYGQCNTKGILFMSLLRSVGIPCRIHGFTIDKKLQKGAMTGLVYTLAPKSIIHSWVEVNFEDRWLKLEGFILDRPYLTQLQKKFSKSDDQFCGYGVATNHFKKPEVDWDNNDTYIQKEGINRDFGIFNDPDTFFMKHNQALSPIKKWFYQNFARKLMNNNVTKIRKGNY